LVRKFLVLYTRPEGARGAQGWRWQALGAYALRSHHHALGACVSHQNPADFAHTMFELRPKSTALIRTPKSGHALPIHFLLSLLKPAPPKKRIVRLIVRLIARLIARFFFIPPATSQTQKLVKYRVVKGDISVMLRVENHF